MSMSDRNRQRGLLVGGAAVLVLAGVVIRGSDAVVRPNLGTASTSAPLSAVSLAANADGYVRVETVSGAAGCAITTQLVVCQRFGGSWAASVEGDHGSVASVSADGQFNWVRADLGALSGRIKLAPQTYSAQGWAVVATSDTTIFINEASGRGMLLSDNVVRPF